MKNLSKNGEITLLGTLKNLNEKILKILLFLEKVKGELKYFLKKSLDKTRIAGIEPTHMILKTIVLPLNYIPVNALK